MEKMIGFEIDFYSKHSESFRELLDNSIHDDVLDLINEALGYYALYEDQVLNRKRVMVMVDAKGSLTEIDAVMTEEHRLLESIHFSLPASSLESIGDDFDPAIINDRIRKSLMLYEEIIEGKMKKMHLGIFDPETRKVALRPMSYSSIPPSSPSFGAGNPYLH